MRIRLAAYSNDPLWMVQGVQDAQSPKLATGQLAVVGSGWFEVRTVDLSYDLFLSKQTALFLISSSF